MLSISPPADITATAITPCGATWCAQVYFSFTVTGGTPPYNLVCGAYPGSLFTVGSHTVGCLAQDHAGNSTPTATFTITVNPPDGGGSGVSTAPAAQDVTPPIIAEHANIAVDANRAAGAVVAYSVVATDPGNTGAHLTIACLPASGSTFPLGPRGSTTTTTVTCAAHDPAGNSAAPQSFTVTVVGAHGQIMALEHDVSTAKQLTKGKKGSLVSTLLHADRSLTSGSITAAKSQLQLFVAQVRKLPPVLAHRRTIWITAATRIVAVVK
jgi:hypothetical protein